MGKTRNNPEDAKLFVASHYMLVSQGRQSSIKKVVKADLLVRGQKTLLDTGL